MRKFLSSGIDESLDGFYVLDTRFLEKLIETCETLECIVSIRISSFGEGQNTETLWRVEELMEDFNQAKQKKEKKLSSKMIPLEKHVPSVRGRNSLLGD